MLRVECLGLRYGESVALDGVSFEVGSHEIMAILGPSGSGKSSLLRAIAGLERPHTGSVHVDGRDVTVASVHRRNVGLMFQDYALFPHLDVAQNVAFGLRMSGATQATIDDRVAEVLSWSGLTGYDQRGVESLSGGEQQRVALARAIAPQPTVLMLDEPVGALDRALRARLVPELSALLRRIGMSALYVTHDQEEAFAIADRIAVLDGGRLVQIATPQDLWRAPANEFVARFLGFENFSDVRVRSGTAVTQWGAIQTDLPDGDHRVVMRPDAVSLHPDGDLIGTVEATNFIAGHSRVTMRCLNSVLVLDVTGVGPEVGTALRVATSRDALHALADADSAHSL